MNTSSSFRSGFVSLIGLPNVGKSSWLNALLSASLSIVTPKAQTTRTRVMGICTTKHYQAIFLDTPGLLRPSYALQKHMLASAVRAAADADLLLYVVDARAQLSDMEKKVIAETKQRDIPMVLLLNKKDLLSAHDKKERIAYWQSQVPDVAHLLVSAHHEPDVKKARQLIVDRLPQGPAYYASDQLSDKSERFVAAEKIRAHVLRHYKDEVPYSTHVWVTAFKNESSILHIHATLYVERASQQAILIGKKGTALRRLGIAARQDLEAFFQKKVYLETTVKVMKDWRRRMDTLKRLGL